MARTDTASRVISASPVDVYAAMVDAAALAEWLPPGNMTTDFERFDLRPGGSYRLVLTYSDGSASVGKASETTDIVEGRFVALIPGERVVQAVDFESEDPAFHGTMTMTWQVAPHEGGTRVDFTADDDDIGDVIAQWDRLGPRPGNQNVCPFRRFRLHCRRGLHRHDSGGPPIAQG